MLNLYSNSVQAHENAASATSKRPESAEKMGLGYSKDDEDPTIHDNNNRIVAEDHHQPANP